MKPRPRARKDHSLTISNPLLPRHSPAMLAAHPASSATPRALLGVETSITGRRWRSRLDRAGEETALAIAQLHGVPEVLARVLAGRGVTAPNAPAFLEPRLRDLMPDPDGLTAMAAAVDRLASAVRAGRPVAIFGDYDVDGACSSALIALFLEAAGVPARVHIPDRITEGYGPNVPAVRAFAAEGAALLVTVDCGTTSHEPLGEAARLGLDVLVLDHHQAPEALPPALAIVNPNRQDCLSGLGHLCAAGVVFMTLVALNRRLRADGHWTKARPEPDLIAMLDLVALATVADVVPLTGLNRAFVRQGLQIVHARGRVGLRALMDAARLNGPPACYHLGHVLGPRINAGGRIGEAGLGARLLMTRDEGEAATISVELDRLNGERQVIERSALEEADAMARAHVEAHPDAPLVVGSAGWHPGIVGLVAARLKERYNLPAFALAMGEGGSATGSGRSVAGVDLGSAVREAVEAGLAVKGGGHAMAAGVTIASDRIDELRRFLGERIGAQSALARGERALTVDAALTARGATVELAGLLEKAGPFGSGQPEPLFAFSNHLVQEASEVGQGHLRLRLKSGDGASIKAMAFRAVGQPLGAALTAARGRPVHVVGSLSVDRWGGGERVDLRLVDAAEAGHR